MRLLVACTACRRQFDASDRQPGQTFPCVCGATVEVRAARPHDAAVVRCSSCGGTRGAGEPACRWCGSEFTLDERDLNTMCPQCLTRISDRARHCHACGVAVAPQPVGAADPSRPCPICPGGPALRHRALGADLALLECARCGGLWLAPGPLRDLVARASVPGQAAQILGPLAGKGPAARERPAAAGPLYRACVVCTQRMNRTRFAGRTPVVVDYCREHGVWFDPDELSTALDALSRAAKPTVRPPEVLPGDEARAGGLRRERRAAFPGLGTTWNDGGWDWAILGGSVLLGILRLLR